MKKAILFTFLVLFIVLEIFFMTYTEKLGTSYHFYFDKIFLIGGVLYFFGGFFLLFNSKLRGKGNRYWLTTSAVALMLLPSLIVNLTSYKKDIIRHQLIKFEAKEIQIKIEDQILLTFHPQNSQFSHSPSEMDIPKECLLRRSGPFGVVFVKFEDCE